jgi:ATP-dependent exoDNAse (exonuclease V) alpha subunit
VTQDEALTILKTGANVFLTGEPGSGKTHTINAYVAWLREHGIEPAITASTGIAATHIGGQTIHSWSGIGIKKLLSSWDLDRISQNERVAKHVRGTDILIIDEISMLSDKTFSMVEAVCREIRANNLPFGGMQVILVGDFFQLPPIQRQQDERGGGKDEWSEQLFDPQSQSHFAFNAPAWKSLKPIICYLEEQHRQEDESFLQILSAIRRGEVEEEHRERLAERRLTVKTTAGTQLFSHNADVDRINDAELAKLTTPAKVFRMSTRGKDNLVENLKRGCLSPEVLTLKVGARVMFTKNAPTFNSQHRSYVNGTLGVVTDFATNGYPVVKTHGGRTLVVEPTEWKVDDQGRILATINQLPLRLAWAMTVHKSQGMSLDAAHMDLSGAFEYGQGYVALSRVRTLEGLSLAGINERALEVHPEIKEQDAVFREESDLARQAFERLLPSELKKMQENFIKASGGTIEIKSKSAGGKSSASNEKGGEGSEGELGGKSKLEKLREKFPNAYRGWSKEEDEDLKERFLSGENQKELSAVFGRQPGSIRARLIKLGLIEEE